MPLSAATQRRLTVVAVAEELFVIRGWTRTTVDTIAARSGEARSTIFEQIGRKIDILLLVAEHTDVRARRVIHDERADARRAARRRARGEVRPRPAASFSEDPQIRAMRRTAHEALVRNTHGALIAPVLRDAHHAGEVDAGRFLRRRDATRRQQAAAALRASGYRPRPALTEAIGELAGPWPYLGLVVGRGWTASAYEDWLSRTLRRQLPLDC